MTIKQLVSYSAILNMLIFVNNSVACEVNMEVEVLTKTNLSFETSDSSMDRSSETYDLSATEDALVNEIKNIVCRTTKLIDQKYLPKKLTIQLENQAIVSGPSYEEPIPSIIVLSKQVPTNNSIILGMDDLKYSPKALNSILSHEVGHMLIEWIARGSGVTDEDDTSISFWSKPIYEGVADFTAACITGNTTIGDKDFWFYRSILKFNTLEESQNPKIGMYEMIESHFKESGITPKYQFYVNWLSSVKTFLEQTGTKDPYSEGTWIAGQLWNLSNKCSNKAIWLTLTDLAESGEVIKDSRKFVERVQVLLNNK